MELATTFRLFLAFCEQNDFPDRQLRPVVFALKSSSSASALDSALLRSDSIQCPFAGVGPEVRMRAASARGILGRGKIKPLLGCDFMELVNLLPEFCWLLLSAAFFGVGEYLSKKFAASPNLRMLLWVCSTSLLGTLAWLPAIVQTNRLSSTGTAWLLLSILATLASASGFITSV